MLTFLAVWPVEAVLALAHLPLVAEPSVPTATWALGFKERGQRATEYRGESSGLFSQKATVTTAIRYLLLCWMLL